MQKQKPKLAKVKWKAKSETVAYQAGYRAARKENDEDRIDAARYRALRTKGFDLLSLSKEDFDAKVDTQMMPPNVELRGGALLRRPSRTAG